MKKRMGLLMALCLALTLQGVSLTSFAAEKKSAAFLLPISVNGLYGYINASGKVVVKPQYLQTDDFSEGYGAFKAKIADKSSYGGTSERFGFMASDGRVVIKPKYVEVGSFHEGIAYVSYYVNRQYTQAFVTPSGKTAFVFSKTLKPKVDMTLFPQKTIIQFSEGLMPVIQQSTGLYGYVNKSGKMVIAAEFDRAEAFKEGRASVIMDGKQAYIDKTGKIVINAGGYERCYGFSDGLARCETITKTDFINRDGKVVLSFEDLRYEDFTEGMAPFYDTRALVGYIDKTGQVVMKPQFYPMALKASPLFSEGLATAAKDSSSVGLINKAGEFVITPQFDIVEPLKNGIIKVHVYSNGKIGYYDKTGKLIWKPSK